ncbi:MAG: hypothetical protein IT210_01975 [Armatimonadetes bacterium]|nr:hypothetical protein [Armatimonadota bacterium]
MRKWHVIGLVLLAVAARAGGNWPPPLMKAKIIVPVKARLVETQQKVNPFITHLYRYEVDIPASKVKVSCLQSMRKAGWHYIRDMVDVGVGSSARASSVGDVFLGTKIVSQPITHHLALDASKGSCQKAHLHIQTETEKQSHHFALQQQTSGDVK